MAYMSTLFIFASSSTVSSNTNNPLLNKIAAKIVGSKYGHVTSIWSPFRILLSGVKKKRVRYGNISGPGPMFPVIRPGFFKFSTKLSPGFAVPPSLAMPSLQYSSSSGLCVSGSSTATSMASGSLGVSPRKEVEMFFCSNYQKIVLT